MPYWFSAGWTPANAEQERYTYAFGYTYGQGVMNATTSYQNLLNYDGNHKNYLSTSEPGVRWAYENKPWED